MTSHPLTHHDILGLVEPFTRRGRHVDLAASNRMERRLVFKPVEHGGEARSLLTLRETLQLDNPQPDTFVLTRTLSLDCGLQATLQATGAQPGELLASAETIPPPSQFRSGAGFVTALSHRLQANAGGTPGSAAAARLTLIHAEARVEGLTLVMKVPAVHGYPADLTLHAAPAGSIELPQDLLAVLGWDWARLDRAGEGWTTTLGLHGKEPERSRRAERQLEKTVLHLARTLAEPPAQFHARLTAARWAVAFRHAIPLLTVVGLVGGALAVPRLGIQQDSAFRMLMFNGPPLLLALGVCMKEMPRFEIPRWPRASRAASWRR